MKIVVKKKSAVLIALTLAATSIATSGCRLFVYDDSCCPPPLPPEPVYVMPAPPPQPVYYAPAQPEPGVYIYSPEPYYAPQPGLDVDLAIRGQAPSDDFPTIDAAFPALDDGASILNPESSKQFDVNFL